MIDWIRKTAVDVGSAAKVKAVEAMNTPAPIGKVIAAVLIIEGVIVVTYLATHKVKVITVFGG